MVCKKIDTCQKITMILDHDLLEPQYAEAIRSVCGKCVEFEEADWCPWHGYPLPCYKCGYLPQPDSSRLLSAEEITGIVEKWYKTSPLYEALVLMGAQAQRDLTASICKEQEQKRVEKLFDVLDRKSPRYIEKHDAYSNGWNNCRDAFYKLIDSIRRG